tara:strand:- start:709 stop:1068 length:360 start_codon:yes stop_codon:yes gene_type:complete
MKKLFIYLPIFLMVLASCSTAQKSSEVQSIKFSVAPYLKMDCKELATEQSSLFKDAQALGAQVDKDYQSDKNAELVTWILFAPAAFWLDGNAEGAGRLASVKGQLEAVQDAMKVNKCVD